MVEILPCEFCIHMGSHQQVGGGVPRFSTALELYMETLRKWSSEKSAVWIIYMNEPLA